jgi:hypothetical protein
MNNRPGDVRPETDEARVEELTARLRAALECLDRGRALYIVVSALIGDRLDRELVVANPDTGRVLAYLLPPGDRHSLYAAARPPAGDVLGDPPTTLEDILRRFSRCMDPSPTDASD